MATNVLGTELTDCSHDPVTGFYRDGCCNTGADDYGVHTVCAIMTEEFLSFSKAAGNDLSTPRNGFSGLNPGDHWCLCAGSVPLKWLSVLSEKLATISDHCRHSACTSDDLWRRRGDCA